VENQLLLWLAVITLGVGFGFMLCSMLFRSERQNVYALGKSDGEKERAALEERIQQKDERIAELQKEKEAERDLAFRLREELAELRAGQTAMEKARETMLESFRAMANEALLSNNEKFLELARVSIERFQETGSKAMADVIKPVEEALQKVDTNLHTIEKERVAAYSGLSEQVNQLLQQGKELRGETAGLVRALRSPSVRGRWGEVQLRRVVELAGMVDHCDYEQQPQVTGEDGAQRPDLIVHLPNKRDIVVDAKVSLSAYLESLESPDEAARVEKLKAHAGQVRAHLQKLSNKAYWKQFETAPEFVVAFLPSETFFSAALEQDPELLEFGAENRVILATPTTLIALLKAVAYGWQQDKLASSAREISELGKTLYDRLITFTGHMEEIRKGLDRAVGSYNKAAGSLESRVLVSARRFKEMGASEAGELPAAEPVESVPRSLAALETAANGEPAVAGV
jgi:DNA recombination protein RmuC